MNEQESISRREHPNTYFVQDRSNTNEMIRLQVQDQMLTTGMGGVLPEQSDPRAFQRVLDVGCGTGGWLIEAARAYPTMRELVGVDVNKMIIEYAREQAKRQGVADRVTFHVMDATRMLEFPPAFFDLINQRLGVSYLRLWDWPKLLSEYQRVGRAGAVIRITESDVAHGNSPSFTLLSETLLQTLYKAGHLKAPEMDATITMLAPLLHQHGFKHVQTRSYGLKYPSGTVAGEAFYEDMKHWKNLVPFFRKWTRLPDNFEEICQQSLVEIKQPGFVGEWNLCTAWGISS